MGELNLGSIKLPISAATKTFAILAKRGAGKSYTGAVMAEEFYKVGVPFIVFDPIDVWWGLRINKNGMDKGFPVVVFGIDHADISLNKDMGRHIVREVVKENISCVISTFGMPKTQQRFLMTEVAEELLNINNTPRHVFIEEAHEFVPQRVFGGLGTVFNAVSNLVVMGRNRGLGVTLINQRAATINKDVLTQLDTLLAFRNVSPQDRKALKEWVEYHSAEGDFEAFMKSLPSLPTGEGWIWSPEFMGVFEKIKIRERETFHPDREKLGENFKMPSLDQVDIQEFIKKFNFHEEAKQADVEEVLASTPVETLKEDIIKIRNDYESIITQKNIETARLTRVINSIRELVGFNEEIPKVSSSGSSNQVDMWIEKLGNGGASRILKFLSEKAGLKFTRSQIALAVGMSARGGSYLSYISTLKRNLLIKEENGMIYINSDLLN